MKSSAERRCIECAKNFELQSWEVAMRQRLDVPNPRRCPTCRARRRLAHVNQIHLFKTVSAHSGKSLVTHFPPTVAFPIVEQEYWHGEQFDASRFGRPYDINRPFFEQYAELDASVPRPNLATVFSRCENSPYANFVSAIKDCYFIFNSNECRDCYYAYGLNNSTDTFDAFFSQRLELCYECVGSIDCYRSAYLYNCERCTDSLFLNNCIGCTDCVQSTNLVHKKNYYRNQEVSAEEMRLIKQQFARADYVRQALVEFTALQAGAPQKALAGYKNQDCLGNHLVNCKNAHFCFDTVDLEDGMYCSQGFAPCRDCLDCDEVGGGELLFESTNAGLNCYNLRACTLCDGGCQNLTYCNFCTQGTSNCIGCIGLKRREYCVLNHQYSADEYRRLSAHIQKELLEQGQWGEFFPPELSPFPFHLTQAALYYPLESAQLQDRGYREFSVEAPSPNSGALVSRAPLEEVSQLSASAIEQPFCCSNCSRAFKILPKELQIAKELNIAPAQQCFLCRHLRRFHSRPPRAIVQVQCATCGLETAGAYSPPRWSKPTCEHCFQQSLT